MSKIICDVCGTRYPDSSEQCPICGCVPNAAAAETMEETFAEEEVVAPVRKAVPGGRFSKSNVRKRNRNQTVYEEPEMPAKAVKAAAPVPPVQEEVDLYEEFEEANSRGGVILNVLLVIVILALLAVSAYIFLVFFMPNFSNAMPPKEDAPAVVETMAPTDAPATEAYVEGADATCQQLILDVTDITLYEAGEMYLLNVQVLPENTTDTIMYISSNEEVATVNEEGRVTAVGEGSVVISIFCGEQQTECNVICAFADETEAPAETEAVEETEEAATEGATEAATEEATEAPTEAPAKPAGPLKDVVLGVKAADMTFRAPGQKATIKLTCDLENNEVTWTSENDKIASVDADGIITRTGVGTTTITGQYGNQKIEIIIRCPKN